MALGWEILRVAGVPLGAARDRRGARVVERDVYLALSRVANEAFDEPQATALAAWLRGFRHHWPSHFARVAGPEGNALAERLMPRTRDEAGRYLKLRRIAIANLARLAQEGAWV